MSYSNIISSKKLLYDKRLDPELYQKEYLKLISKLEKSGSKTIRQIANKIYRGKLPNYDDEGNVAVIKSGLVMDSFIKDKYDFTNESFLKKYPDVEIKLLDILVNSTGRGTLGRSSIFLRKIKAVADGHLTVIRDYNNYSPFILNLFLQSRFGQFQINKLYRGSSGQIEIYPEDIANIIVPEIDESKAKSIENDYKKILVEYENTLNEYDDIENELYDRIPFNFDEKFKSKSFKVTQNEILRSKRLDSNFYKPLYKKLDKFFSKNNSFKLNELCESPYRGVQPIYDENGEYNVINSKNIKKTEIDYINTKRINKLFYNNDENKKFRIKKNDVLMYSTGAYIGQTNIFIKDEKFIASNHVTLIRPKNDKVNPFYLSLFLNSKFGLYQTDKYASGSAQREIYPENVSQYDVLLPFSSAQKIDSLWIKKISDRMNKFFVNKIEFYNKLKHLIKKYEDSVPALKINDYLN
jgi:restriction endonuclease S subunit